jgi:transcription elongation factor
MGGVIAGVLLVVFAIGAIAIGVAGRHEVRQNIAREAIVGSPDMTPAAIKSEAAKAGLKNVSLPTCSVANQSINTGDTAKCFASYMRIHALEATGGLTYAQMGRFLDANGKQTNDQNAAAVDPKTKRPVENLARNTWVTETALTTALNTSFFAERVALFSIVMGIALLLTGIGFLVLAYLGVLKRREPVKGHVPVAVA